MHKSFNNRRIRKMQTRLGDSIVSIEVRLEEYSLFTPEGIEFLKQAMIIVATCDLHEPLVLFGSDEVERWKITDLTHGAAMVIKVTSFAELQAAIALIRKHRGRADTDGQPWFDL